jgi:hypothetical protein
MVVRFPCYLLTGLDVAYGVFAPFLLHALFRLLSEAERDDPSKRSRQVMVTEAELITAMEASWIGKTTAKRCAARVFAAHGMRSNGSGSSNEGGGNGVEEGAKLLNGMHMDQSLAGFQMLVQSELIALRHELVELRQQNSARASSAEAVAFATNHHSISALASTMTRVTQSEAVVPTPCDGDMRSKMSVRAASEQQSLTLEAAGVSAQRLELRTNEPSSRPRVEVQVRHGTQSQKVHVLKKRRSTSQCVPSGS